MSDPDINMMRDQLLLEMSNRRATNQRPIDPVAVLKEHWPDSNWPAVDARSAAYLLIKNEPKLAKLVKDSDRPGLNLIAETAAGKSEAAKLKKPVEPPPKSINWPKWSVIFTAVIAIVAALEFGRSVLDSSKTDAGDEAVQLTGDEQPTSEEASSEVQDETAEGAK